MRAWAFSTQILPSIQGTRIVDLGMRGCRPDVSLDGKKIAWSLGDFCVGVGDIDLEAAVPKVTNQRELVTTSDPLTVYHADWSPDGKYVAFSGGPHTKRLSWHPALIGIEAKGWNIIVADAKGTNRWVAITRDGFSNKEPDWVPVRKGEK